MQPTKILLFFCAFFGVVSGRFDWRSVAFRTSALANDDPKEDKLLSQTEFSVPEEFNWQNLQEKREFFSWEEDGFITPVKSQGHCGSCYVFATMALVEAVYAIRFYEKPTFSEQEVIDCNNLSLDCNGGEFNETFYYIVNNGVHLSSVYPPNVKGGHRRQVCQLRNLGPKYNYTTNSLSKLRYTHLPADELSIMWWLKNQGPVYVGVYMIPGWTANTGQIIGYSERSGGIAGHAMLLVGYGFMEESKTELVPYWILKNSWGHERGFDGYLRYLPIGNLGNVTSNAIGVFFDDDPMPWRNGTTSS